MTKQFQPELFKLQHDKEKNIKRLGVRPMLFGFFRAHEKTIIVIIIIFIVSLISFSLGVEKGKGLAVRHIGQPKINTAKPKPILAKDQLEYSKNNPVQSKEKTDLNQKKETPRYTVQVATFKTKTHAEKEAKRLKDKGLEAQIIPRGNNISVCVGNFSEKQNAQVSLDQLKKTYHDCFIRRL
ncbi:MAG: SPOR domain-containing protein [Candidatus Omnitrophota bacterium]